MLTTLRNLIILFVALLLTGTAIAQPSAKTVLADATGYVETSVLQYAHDRLYFPVGEESLVYKDARVQIFLPGEDTSICSQHIQHSWQGVSATYPLRVPLLQYGLPLWWQDCSPILEGIDLSDVTIRITPADVDSTSRAAIGTDIIGLVDLLRQSDLSRVTISEYAYRPAMIEDLNNGSLDAVVSFRSLREPPGGYTRRSLAPFVASVIPNVGRECNAGGQLTTSLYYRFDEAKLPLVFTGELHQAQHRFHIYERSAEDVAPSRWYPFNPERGRTLFANINKPENQVSIYYGNDSLERLAYFFADILSRDRCQINLTRDRRDADVYVDFLPVSNTVPSVTAYALHHQFVIDSTRTRGPNEYVRQMAAYFRFVENPPSEDDYYRNLEAAERVAIDDIGAFPLFRPTLHLAAHKHLQDVSFDAAGNLDAANMYRVVLPGSRAIGER